MGRAIITFGRGWHALAAVRSLGRQGIDVYCGEEGPFAPCFFSKYCAGSFQHPSVSNEPEEFVDFLVDKVRELKPPDDEPYVLMPIHKETWLIAKHRERFEPYIRVPLTSHENMAQVHDKGRLATLAGVRGIRTPRTWQFRSMDEVYRAVPDLPLPAFLKVREGASGVGLKKVETAEELVASYKEFVDGFGLEPDEYPLIQEFVKGQDYCVTALFDRGRCVAKMTYHNVRAFPRGTGAGALRETVSLPEAEEASVELLSHLNWHGMAELDFRQAADGPPYLIEVNPRFFGGLHQAVAANVDYPSLLYKLACGEEISESPEADTTVRTETPIVGLLATLEEIAHDDRLRSRLDRVRRELGGAEQADSDDPRLRRIWNAIREAGNPRDLKSYFKEMFAKHRDSIDDVLDGDDPLPALGFLFPIAMMLRHGKLSMGVLTGEGELSDETPRRRFRDLLRRPRWTAMLLTAALFVLCVLTGNIEATRNNVGLILGWPMRVAESLWGPIGALGTAGGALRYTVYHGLNLLFLFIVSALILRQRPERRSDQ
jgi:predicted ATP-grasp superfamily ATP-dependent carboligase